MHQRRWLVLVGLQLVSNLVAMAVVRLAQPAAKAGGLLAIPRVVACAAGHGAGAGKAQPGTAWKTIDRIDAVGAITSRQLFVGTGSKPVANATLPVESSVSGPVG